MLLRVPSPDRRPKPRTHAQLIGNFDQWQRGAPPSRPITGEYEWELVSPGTREGLCAGRSRAGTAGVGWPMQQCSQSPFSSVSETHPVDWTPLQAAWWRLRSWYRVENSLHPIKILIGNPGDVWQALFSRFTRDTQFLVFLSLTIFSIAKMQYKTSLIPF